MGPKRTRQLAAVVAGLAVLPAGWARANTTVVHGGSAVQTTGPGARGGGPPEGPTQHVDERFSREITGGCRFVEAVTGVVTRSNGGLAPDVRADARIECPAMPPRQLGAHAIRGKSLSAPELEAQLASRGAVRVRNGDQVCTYAPAFSVTDAGLVRGEAVVVSCAEVPGGREVLHSDPEGGNGPVGPEHGVHKL